MRWRCYQEYWSFSLVVGNDCRKELKFDWIPPKPIKYLNELFIESTKDQLKDKLILISIKMILKLS